MDDMILAMFAVPAQKLRLASDTAILDRPISQLAWSRLQNGLFSFLESLEHLCILASESYRLDDHVYSALVIDSMASLLSELTIDMADKDEYNDVFREFKILAIFLRAAQSFIAIPHDTEELPKGGNQPGLLNETIKFWEREAIVERCGLSLDESEDSKYMVAGPQWKSRSMPFARHLLHFLNQGSGAHPVPKTQIKFEEPISRPGDLKLQNCLEFVQSEMITLCFSAGEFLEANDQAAAFTICSQMDILATKMSKQLWPQKSRLSYEFHIAASIFRCAAQFIVDPGTPAQFVAFESATQLYGCHGLGAINKLKRDIFKAVAESDEGTIKNSIYRKFWDYLHECIFLGGDDWARTSTSEQEGDVCIYF